MAGEMVPPATFLMGACGGPVQKPEARHIALIVACISVVPGVAFSRRCRRWQEEGGVAC
jgi:hypothetical protein